MKATKIMTKAAVLLLGGMMAAGCTDLNEELYGRLTPDNYYQTEDQALSSLAGCYEYMAYMSRAGGDSWRIGEYGTDELYCPGRANGGWYDEGVNQIIPVAKIQHLKSLPTAKMPAGFHKTARQTFLHMQDVCLASFLHYRL